MKRIATVVCVLVALCMTLTIFSGCGGGSKLDSIKQKGELTILTNAEFPPFEYLDENNQVVGADIDIANEIAKELGVKLKVDNMDFDGIIPAVQSGKGDLGVAGITADDTRRKSVEFSVNYVDAAQYAIVKQGGVQIAEPKDLVGKTIGVQLGTTGDLFVSGLADNEDIGGAAKEVKRYKSGLEAATDLVNGRLDCVVIDDMPAAAIVKANADTLVRVENPMTVEQYAIAMAKGDEEFKKAIDDALQKLINEGKVAEFIAKHMEKGAK